MLRNSQSRTFRLCFRQIFSQIQSTPLLLSETSTYMKKIIVAFDRYPLSMDCQIRSSDFIYLKPCMWPAKSYLAGTLLRKISSERWLATRGTVLLISCFCYATNSMVYGSYARDARFAVFHKDLWLYKPVLFLVRILQSTNECRYTKIDILEKITHHGCSIFRCISVCNRLTSVIILKKRYLSKKLPKMMFNISLYHCVQYRYWNIESFSINCYMSVS